MTSEKDTLLKQLDEARDYIWGLLDEFDPTWEIYPGWTSREFFTHIAGWEAMVWENLRDYTEGRTPKRYAYKDLDEANADFVGVNENTEIQLNVYPNPATGSITISLNDQFSSGIATIIVTDAAGRIISESTSTENRLTLATENWKAGYYTIRLISGQQTATAKICKQ